MSEQSYLSYGGQEAERQKDKKSGGEVLSKHTPSYSLLPNRYLSPFLPLSNSDLNYESINVLMH
jgi:hypothetical protein